MQDDFRILFTPTSTGIMVEVAHNGRRVAYREVSAALMRHYVAEHADRHAAIQFDAAISDAMRRTDEPNGNLAGIFSQIAVINNIANGVQEIAS